MSREDEFLKDPNASKPLFRQNDFGCRKRSQEFSLRMTVSYLIAQQIFLQGAHINCFRSKVDDSVCRCSIYSTHQRNLLSFLFIVALVDANGVYP